MSQRCVVVVLALCGCVGTPVPIPTPIESRLLRLSYPTHGGVVVAGLPGAATGACPASCSDVTVLIENKSTGARAYGLVNATGGFAITVPATFPETLELRAVVDGVPSAALSVALPGPSGRPAPQAQVTQPDGSGVSTIDVFSLPGEHPVVTLPRTGMVAAADRAFSTKQPAQVGDTVYVFALDDAGRSSEHRVLVVSPTPPACADADGDGFGAVGSDLAACPGSTSLPDCNEAQKDVHPSQTQLFAVPIPGAPPGSAFDYDCDGQQQPELPGVVSCGATCGGTGWVGSVPACGETGTWALCVFGKTGCVAQTQGQRAQACR